MQQPTREEHEEHKKLVPQGDRTTHGLTIRLQEFFNKMPKHKSSDPLVSFLYLLMRDHLPAGEVVRLIAESNSTEESTFTNGHMAQFAELCAQELQQ